MEGFGTITFPMLADEEESCSASAVPSNGSFYSTLLQGVFVEECMASASEDRMASLCQSQQQCVKASIVSSWQLVEAQDQLCGLELHGSESVEQEHARAIASQSELSQTEQEWRRKENMLGGSRSPVLSADSSQDVFDKKEALMEQVAHQAVALQFILEMASTSQQDPRSCFRHFFHKAKAGQEGYLDVFHTELEAFKQRVKEHTVKCKGETLPNFTEHQSSTARCRPEPGEVLESLPPELKSGFQLQDMQILQNVLSTMNPQVAEYHVKRCLEAGLWTNREGRWSKEDATLETDDLRMMET
ncbi:hsp90 co-chaperone Cdc37-like 1 isoform X2 [Oncorhynchus nerka]|uniref:hsp90 co-chaperone Cdc37-like 1 isoform X2 n=1 Tax=Oncorhynchus nerka TaxID=8023 RepID=UPI00113201E9|nr:hsp90 co-chaperone Cdc37-like 1 isoform X2 [Oncorhynchus nerka]